jgi:hypothetical protein
MTPPSADRRPRSDIRVGPNARNPFDRDPLLVPSRLDDEKPWRRRRALMAKLVATMLLAGALGAIARYGDVETVRQYLAGLTTG